MQKKIEILTKIFLVWILLHFFIHTFVTFILKINFNIIWAWKEIFLVFFLWLVLYFIFKKPIKKQFIKPIIFFEIIFVLLVLFSFIISYLLYKIPLSSYILAFKYDFLWFLIWFIFYHLAFYINDELIEKVTKFYIKLLKVVLIAWFFWFLTIATIPGVLKLFGYSRSTYEWSLNKQPPAVYFTQETYWIARNQFVFERPISYWFFLIAFFPIFYLLVLRRRKLEKTFIWYFLYGFNIISTFSRAAIWVFIIEIILLWFIEYRKNIKTLFTKLIIPVIIITSLLWIVFYKKLLKRQFSDTGHIQLAIESINLAKQKPILWFWAASSWPASHWYCASYPNTEICKKIKKINVRTWDKNLKWFNNENQYLQILVEFWSIWLLLYLILFLSISLLWLFILFKNYPIERKYILYILWLSLWAFWLLLEWFVLHSFVDRMIVYPFMLLYGLNLGFMVKNLKKD